MDIDHTARLDLLLPMISNVPYHARSDLNKLYGNCRGLADMLSKEAVTCRRLHRPTQTYIELNSKLGTMIDELEQWITFASLL